MTRESNHARFDDGYRSNHTPAIGGRKGVPPYKDTWRSRVDVALWDTPYNQSMQPKSMVCN